MIPNRLSLDCHQQVFQAVGIQVRDGVVHRLVVPHRSDAVLVPSVADDTALSGVLEPQRAAPLACPISGHNVRIAVQVDVLLPDRHDPARVVERVKLPRRQISRVRRSLEPTDLRSLSLGTRDQVGAMLSVDLRRQCEHPLGSAAGRRQFLGDPSVWLQQLLAVRRAPMHEYRPRVSFARADHVHVAVRIEVNEHSILGLAHLADGDSGPALPQSVGAGVQVDADLPALLPRGGNVQAAVAVDVC